MINLTNILSLNEKREISDDIRDFEMFAVRNSQQYGIGKIRTHEVFASEIRMRTQCGTAFKSLDAMMRMEIKRVFFYLTMNWINTLEFVLMYYGT